MNNYINPACCVATVCHQARCMYWGHLGHFHRAISHLRWYKIVCKRYLVCTFSQMKSINIFSMFWQSGVPRHFLWKFIAVWIYNLTVFMFMYVNVDLKLLWQYAETWVFGMFSCCVHHGKYIWGLGNCICCFMWCVITHPCPDFNRGLDKQLLNFTHWGWVMHMWISKLTIIGSYNGLSPGRLQAIIWTNAGILLIRPLGTSFGEILIAIQTF